MSRAVAWFTHSATFLVGASGLTYAVMRYLLRPADPYAVVNHPWQPAVQHLHLLTAPLLVFACGLIWQHHICPGLGRGRTSRWWSGAATSASLVPMIVSGYLIQITVADSWRAVWVAVHVVASVLWIGGYALHFAGRWRRRGEVIAVTAASLRGSGVFAAGRDTAAAGEMARKEARRRAPARRARVAPLALLIVGLAPFSPPVAVTGCAATAERELVAMGTTLRIAVSAATREAALAASERAVAALARAESRLSTWRDDSELARLNLASVGEPFALSPELYAELALAKRFWIRTRGAFDPGIGALVHAWCLRSGGCVPSGAARRSALLASGMDKLDLRPGTAVRLHAGFRVEEGGFGKGAGLDAAVEALAECGIERAILDLGGQVAYIGDQPLAFAIADPRDRDRPVLVFPLVHGSAATSALSERRIVVDGIAYGHILDPRSGLPCPDVGSVTVVAADALTADCLSTGLYVLGPDAALAWAGAEPGVEVVVLELTTDGLRARATPGLTPQLSVLAADVHLD